MLYIETSVTKPCHLALPHTVSKSYEERLVVQKCVSELLANSLTASKGIPDWA